MTVRLYVGSLSYGVNDSQLKDFFTSAGTVASASVITDRSSGQSKGFGFVEMSSDAEAKEAIKTLNKKELDGRSITVNEAKPREERSQNSFGGGFNRGGRRY